MGTTEQNEDVDYIGQFKKHSLPEYIDIFKLSKKTVNYYFHVIFLVKCEQEGVIPKGMRVKHEPNVSTKNALFFEKWEKTVAEGKRDTLGLTFKEYQNLLFRPK